MKKWMYEIVYRYPFISIPWDSGPRKTNVDLVESGRIKPGRAIDLGCGTASNIIYLAQNGFDVTGIDFSPAAIELGLAKAHEVGVEVKLIVDDLTNLKHVNGTFDLLVDYGVLDDLTPSHRNLYMKNILPLTHPGSLFLFFCFEWQPRWWERIFFDNLALKPGEVEHRFGEHFKTQILSKVETGSIIMPMWATYLLTRY